MRTDARYCPVCCRLTECVAVRDEYANEALFRKRIVMQSHGYGRGEYQYFAYPLPERVAAMRSALYPPLADIANRWNEAMRVETRYPAEHAAYLEECHRAGQTRPTPLVLKYGAGDYNCLHQDLYGDLFFPLQVAVLLSDPDAGLQRRRIRAHRAAAAHAVARGSGAVAARRRRGVSGAASARAWNARRVSCDTSPWRESSPIR